MSDMTALVIENSIFNGNGYGGVHSRSKQSKSAYWKDFHC